MSNEKLYTTISQDALDSLVQFACHDGFADFGGSSGACEAFTESLADIVDQILRIEPRAQALEVLGVVIEDLIDNQDEC